MGGSGLVQVAEQYLLMPAYAARLALVRTGLLGLPTQVHVSSTQQYHAVSIARGLLGVGRTPVTVRASRFVAPLVSPLSRAGWTDDDVAHPTPTTLATLDLGAGRSALYDFTEGQTRNQGVSPCSGPSWVTVHGPVRPGVGGGRSGVLRTTTTTQPVGSWSSPSGWGQGVTPQLRFRRLLVRGTHGELSDDTVVRLAERRTVLRERIERRQTGHDVDLGGFDTEHLSVGGRLLWRNPYVGRRWMDDEIAIAALLDATAGWARGDGPPPYPLADGLHDHQVALAVEQSVEQDGPVTTSVEAWTEP